MMKTLTIFLAVVLEFVPAGQAFLRQLQQRDSILIADQLEYGVRIDDVKEGTSLALPDFSKVSNDTLTLVRPWRLDSLAGGRKLKPGALARWMKKGKPISIEASIIVAPFEEGEYELPDIPVIRSSEGVEDTLLFEAQKMDVKTMPVDTATFRVHDIKGQIRYPVTFSEVLPYGVGAVVLASLVFLAVWILRRKAAERKAEETKDPAHVVALRELDKYRSDRFWAPEKQKAFYSGITDVLKNYIDARFGVDAPEMTTAELFDALKKEKDITPDLYNETRNLFERADFVKFAKYVASEEDNAGVLPLAVRFVTGTYQAEIEKEAEQ